MHDVTKKAWPKLSNDPSQIIKHASNGPIVLTQGAKDSMFKIIIVTGPTSFKWLRTVLHLNEAYICYQTVWVDDP